MVPNISTFLYTFELVAHPVLAQVHAALRQSATKKKISHHPTGQARLLVDKLSLADLGECLRQLEKVDGRHLRSFDVAHRLPLADFSQQRRHYNIDGNSTN
jgi:hypothetical protein